MSQSGVLVPYIEGERKRKMEDFEYYTVATFYINGSRQHIEITAKDEDMDIQTDEAGRTTCLASNAYWALVTLEQAGKIENLDFKLCKRYA